MQYRSLQIGLGCVCYNPKEQLVVHSRTDSQQAQPQVPGKLMLFRENIGSSFEGGEGEGEKKYQKIITCYTK